MSRKAKDLANRYRSDTEMMMWALHHQTRASIAEMQRDWAWYDLQLAWTTMEFFAEVRKTHDTP